MIDVVTALPGVAWEGEVVGRLEGTSGVRVVRRCVDLPDLLSVSAAGNGHAVLVCSGLRHLDRDALARLRAAHVAVVGLVSPGDEQAEQALRALGIAQVLPGDSAGAVLGAALKDAVAALLPGADEHAFSEPLRAMLGSAATLAPHDLSGLGASDLLPPARGRVVAVWGPTGAPGRTTVALGVAAEAARLGVSALLVDADSYGGVVAAHLGLLDESPGLAAAARLASTGGLDLAALARVAPVVVPGLRVLTGIHRADRWPELRPAALEEVYDRARRLADLVVVDCGFCLEQDEELSFDTAAPRRNGATLMSLEQADTVLAVCAADAIGVQRLVRSLAELREVVPGAEVRVVVNRVRRSAVGPRPEAQLAQALERYAGVTDIVFVPEDRDGLDAALLQGATLPEAAAGSPVRPPLQGLAEQLTGVAVPRQRRHRLTRRLGRQRGRQSVESSGGVSR